MLSSDEVTEPVTVRTAAGSGYAGMVFGDPVSTLCQFEGGRKVVRDTNGDEVVSETTIRLDPDTIPGLDLEALFTPASQVAVRGRDTTVIAAQPHLDVGELVYLEVNLA